MLAIRSAISAPIAKHTTAATDITRVSNRLNLTGPDVSEATSQSSKSCFSTTIPSGSLPLKGSCNRRAGPISVALGPHGGRLAGRPTSDSNRKTPNLPTCSGGQPDLLSNALKFTLPGGTVTAFAHARVDGRAAFGVSDTGVGIAPEDQAKVFEKFGQGRHAHVPKEAGTGLGLSIVRGLIDAHGGQIGLKSVEHEGTTVTVMLPSYRTILAQLQTRQSAAKT
jgi:hypothetical protein